MRPAVFGLGVRDSRFKSLQTNSSPLRSSRLPKNEELAMKKNNWDDNEFRNDFHSLNRVPAAGTECDFNLTFVADAGLSTRLANEVQFLLRELQLAWPAFRCDPVGFIGCLLRQLGISVAKTIRRPHVVSGVATALLL